MKGGEPAEVELRFTRHGPVIYEGLEKNVAFAVRAAWLEPGTAFFEVWCRLHLREALLTRAMESIVEPGRLVETVSRVMQVEDQAGDARMELEILEKLETRLGPEVVDEVMLSSLRDSTERLEGLLGADRWEWGKRHHAFLDHPYPRSSKGEPASDWTLAPRRVVGAGTRWATPHTVWRISGKPVAPRGAWWWTSGAGTTLSS